MVSHSPKLDENSTFISEAPTPRNPPKCDPYRKYERMNQSLSIERDDVNNSKIILDDEDTYYEYGPKP